MAKEEAKSSKLWLVVALLIVAVVAAGWQFSRTVAPGAGDVSFTTPKPAPPDGARRDAAGNVIGAAPEAETSEEAKTGTR